MLGNVRGRGFEVVNDEFKKHPNENIKLPTRSDSRSAGYDFYCPCDIELQPNEKVLLFTDVKAYMMEDEVLMLYVRSSVGTKLGVILSNGTGIIDSSYYGNPSNDGNIGLPLWNTSDKVVKISKGHRVAQGVFIKYYTTDNDTSLSNERKGGFGSSDK